MRSPLCFGRLLLPMLVVVGLSRADEGGTRIEGVLHPVLSPDGETIALSYQGGIWIYSPADGIMTQRTGGGPWDIEPAWSPDGKQIAFLRTDSFASGYLHVIDALSGEEHTFPDPVAGQGRLQYSPDGKRVLGYFRVDGPHFTLAWADLETGKLTPVPMGPIDPASLGRKRIKYALSPDGTKIAYALHRDEPDEQGGNRGPQADLWIGEANGENPQNIVTWPARVYDLIFDGEEALLAVSDLGTMHNNIWRIPLENSLATAKKVTTGFTDDERPSLNALGDSLVWSNNAAGATILHQLNRQTSAISSLIPTKRVYRQSAGKLHLRLADSDSHEPVTARVSIRSAAEGFVFPPDALYRVTGKQGHYYAVGASEFEVPSGRYNIEVFRGPEYRPWRTTIDVAKGKTTEVSASLERWTNQSAQGWWSGENHVHANYGYGEWYNSPATILRQCQGENLNVCNAVIGNSDGEAVFDREFFIGAIDPKSTADTLMYWGQEFRSTLWGHMTLSNLAQLVEPIMTGFESTTNPWDVPTNGDIAQRVNDQKGAAVSYTHPAGNFIDPYDQAYSAKGMPVDAALGKVLLMDVMGNTYEGSLQLWYRLMNCGLPVFASAGTDCFLNRVRSMPPGWARTYVHLPEGLGYAAWTAGQQKGESFITNGPMLTFLYQGEPAAGTEIALDQPTAVAIHAEAKSQFPMDRVELILNGEIVESLPLSDDKLSAVFSGSVEVSESGWLALRSHGPAHRDVIREPDAHTNPIRFTVKGHPNAKAAEDAAYFLKWIDRLQGDFEKRNRWPTENAKRHVLSQLEQARKYYQSVAR